MKKQCILLGRSESVKVCWDLKKNNKGWDSRKGELLEQRYQDVAAAAKSLQSCPTLFDPIDGSPPGSPVPGILQARKLEWVAISFSNGWKWKVKGKLLSRVRLSATPWTAAYQAPQSTGFSRQEYWSGVPSPSPYGQLSWVNTCKVLKMVPGYSKHSRNVSYWYFI